MKMPEHEERYEGNGDYGRGGAFPQHKGSGFDDMGDSRSQYNSRDCERGYSNSRDRERDQDRDRDCERDRDHEKDRSGERDRDRNCHLRYHRDRERGDRSERRRSRDDVHERYRSRDHDRYVIWGEMERMTSPLQTLHTSVMWRYILGFSWYLLHLLVSIMHIGSHLIHVIVCYMISCGLLEKYRKLRLHKLQYLAVVVDSEEAKNTTQIEKLLHWLSDIGLKYTILYDMEGVLKKSLETNQSSLSNSRTISKSCADASNHEISRIYHEKMTIELLSSSDGKDGAVKAANFLFSNYLNGDKGRPNKIEPKFTEGDMAASLKAVGCDGPDPDLLLIYGPARCHLGFPAWRMRYTEIVHLGPLKAMKYGAIVKAIYDYSNRCQNYGT